MTFVAPLRNASAVLEAAYDVGRPPAAWLQRLLRAMASDLDGGLGLYAVVLDLAHDGLPLLARPAFHRMASAVRDIAPALSHNAPPAVVEHFRTHAVEFGSVSQLFGPAALGPIRERALPFVDSVGLAVQDGDGAALQVVSLMPDVVRVHGRSRAAWRKLGLHLGIAWRLRTRLARGGVPDALLRDGKVVDARGDAAATSARAALIDATRRIEHARATRDDPARVLELWTGLVQGRWSLVDTWERDGRRYVAAYENAATVGPVPGFTSRELAVLELHLLRARRDEIALALGLSLATIDRVLSTAARRVGLRNRAELGRLAEPRWMTRLALDLEADRIDVLRFDEPALPPLWRARLTPAQLEVAHAAARGLADGEIAAARGSSVRTVSNLLAATYRVLGLAGRRELVRACLPP